MKKLFTALCAAIFLASCASEYPGAGDLYVSFVKPSVWGKGVFSSPFPPSQVCKEEGGQGKTPALFIDNIPDEANLLILEINNLLDPALSHNGGLGAIGFYHDENTPTAVLLPVPGETLALPKYAFREKPNRVNASKPYAYLPPCQIKGRSEYSATVKAVRRTGSFDTQKTEILAVGSIYLGEY